MLSTVFLSAKAFLGSTSFVKHSYAFLGIISFFQKLPFMDNVERSVLTAVPPLSVVRVPVKLKSARGKKILAGTYRICFTAHDKLGVWDSLNRVNHEAVIFSVLTNITNDEQFYKTGDIVRFFQPVPE